ncbi:hypothetical protein FO519_002138 [Halicephalobus sp. NKZ332]|nr:hypothetical protein FO519_002138 [Halicephalobus sp. NKZ332]
MKNSVNRPKSGNRTPEVVKNKKIAECNQRTREGLYALSRVDLPSAIKHLGRATESWLAYYFEYEQDLLKMSVSVGTQFPEVNETEIAVNERNVIKVVMEISNNFSMRVCNFQFYSIVEGYIRTLEVESIKLLTVILSGVQTVCESDELTSEQKREMIKWCQVGLLTERYNEALKIYCRIINLLILHLHPMTGTPSWSEEAERKLKGWREEVKEPWDFIVKELAKKNNLNQSKHWFGRTKKHMNVLLTELRKFKASRGMATGTKKKMK